MDPRPPGHPASVGPKRADYEEIADGYTTTRREDPRLADRIWEALGAARSVLNVGAGAGSYEPHDREVLAVEPSAAMIAQRPAGAPRVVRADAEALPFEDDSFDAVMAILTDHHWRDRRRALSELTRVARQRVVLFNADPAQAERFWLTHDYLPGFLDLIPPAYSNSGHWPRSTEEALGTHIHAETVPIPHDCHDGFYGAYWRRPHAYLDERVRAGISVFARLPQAEVQTAINQLRKDLDNGDWQARNAGLLKRDTLDLGYTLLTAKIS